MLELLDESLRSLFYQSGGIDPREVDVLFDPPTKERVQSLTRPAVSLFLYDVQENTDLRQSGPQTSRMNGHSERRMPPLRFDARYLVSALATVVEDEHLLFWRALATLLRHPQLPEGVLPEAL